MRIVQVPFLATLAVALRDFYNEYEDDERGYAYLPLELRAWVCGAPRAEVVARSGAAATAIFVFWPWAGLRAAIRTVYHMCV